MKKVKSIVILLVCALLLYTPYCSAEYTKLDLVQLNGKRVQIHGPYYLDYIGIAQDEETCRFLVAAAESQSARLFRKIFNAFGIMVIRNNTPAMVLAVKGEESMAKVYIFSGVYKGATGWIPLAWLRNNTPLARFSDTPF
jgi:hypothetical protein